MSQSSIPGLYIYIPERNYLRAMAAYLRMRALGEEKDNAIIRACLECEVKKPDLEWYVTQNEIAEKQHEKENAEDDIEEPSDLFSLDKEDAECKPSITQRLENLINLESKREKKSKRMQILIKPSIYAGLQDTAKLYPSPEGKPMPINHLINELLEKAVEEVLRTNGAKVD